MATTPIDELVVKIVLNGKEFEAQLKQADQGVKNFAKQVETGATTAERGAQKMVDGFSRVTKEILGVGAAILGVNGLKDLAINLTQVAAATDRMAQAFEIDPEMLNKWQGFLQAVGNQDFGTTTASLTALSDAIKQYRLTLKGPFADPETLGALNRLGVTTGDLTAPGKVSDIMNKMLLTMGQNINRPENADIKSFLLSHVPGMTPTMMRGLERGPSQATLDKYLTATAAQMASASRMMEEIAELALALRKRLNELLPLAEGPVHEAVAGAQEVLSGEPGKAWERGVKIDKAIGNAIVEADMWKKGSWLDNFLMFPGYPNSYHKPISDAGDAASVKPAGFSAPDHIWAQLRDTSTMTKQFPSFGHRAHNMTNYITLNVPAPKSDNPQVWGATLAEHFAAVAAHAHTGAQ